MQKLFSYGTLQYKKVQIKTFGRELKGKKDKLIRYKIYMIKNQKVISSSGESEHPIIEYTGNKKDLVEGVLFKIDNNELLKADLYEVKEYKRIEVVFVSGEKGWVYVKS